MTHVEPLVYENNNRPKDWKAPEFKQPIAIPGALTKDEWFRGWVTLTRNVEWKSRGNLQPRMLYLSGVSNSASLTVNGAVVGEVLPVEDIEVLSHWIEYHSQFKGEDKKLLRMQMLDEDVQPPMTMQLPAALPKAGQAAIEMKIRGTHGMFRPKSPLRPVRRSVPGIGAGGLSGNRQLRHGKAGG